MRINFCAARIISFEFLALARNNSGTPIYRVPTRLYRGSGRLCRPQKEAPMKFRPLHDRVVIRRAEGDT
ncbi:hypothetical protein EH240_15405, partial [Mesorhizobium tamadayense]